MWEVEHIEYRQLLQLPNEILTISTITLTILPIIRIDREEGEETRRPEKQVMMVAQQRPGS